MNICMFTNTFLPHVGGVARSVATFADDLRQKGHQVLIIAPTFPHVSRGEDAATGAFRVPAIQNFNGSDFSVRLPVPYPVHERIDKFKPDIIHSHHPFLLGDTALRIARAHGLPLVFSHHTFYEHYTHYIPFDSELVRSFVRRLSSKYANLCHGVIAPSESVAEIIRARGVERPIAVIPTGVDLSLFKGGRSERFRRQHGLSSGTHLIGHVGRLAAEKNLAYLARAVASYLGHNQDCRFAVVGHGEAETTIREIFAEVGAADRLILTGPLQHENLADAYRAFDLFVFSSQTETQGVVLAEAMAAGTPVIALDAPGAREVVKDGNNGRLLAATATSEEFSSAIEDFFRDPARAAAWRRQARQTARRFSRPRCAERMLSFYGQIIRRHLEVKPTATKEMDDSVIEMLKGEWELLQEKVAAAVSAAVDHKHRKD